MKAEEQRSVDHIEQRMEEMNIQKTSSDEEMKEEQVPSSDIKPEEDEIEFLAPTPKSNDGFMMPAPI